MIQPSHPAPTSGGTGPVNAATPPKSALQQTYRDKKTVGRRHQTRRISRPVLASFAAQCIASPDLESQSP